MSDRFYKFRMVTEGESPHGIGLEISGDAPLGEIESIHAVFVGIRKGLPIEEALDLISKIRSKGTN